MPLGPLVASILLLASASAQPQAPAAPPAAQSSQRASKPPPPRVAGVTPAPAGACAMLPKPRSGPPPFSPGELLSYDIDVMGVRAGTMSFEVLPAQGRGKKAVLPVRVRAESNTFFNKVRKVKAELVSYLRAKDLRPDRFHEDLREDNRHRIGDVDFERDKKLVKIAWRTGQRTGSARNEIRADALDYIGAIYLFRAIPLSIGQTFCFDVYAMRRMWRVEGKVEAREHVSTPAGEFDAFHLSGVATRIGGSPLKREVHVWISDDAMRLPLAAMGVIDLGPVRAVLSSVARPDFKSSAARPSKMEW
ncbi:MAG: DUF3108 domain-containing protein [Myxococcales bacterium]|jgi:hypothetical protein